MKKIRTWLWIGIIMVLIQVLLGGITRLTGSGLSITEWDLIMGAIPPTNEHQWIEAFDKYKDFPQYNLVNQDMTIGGFKKIFFWEYLHRNWARLIGLVFIIPFIYFLIKRKLNKEWKIKLIFLLLLGGLQGLMGWIMVASGLIDTPWVSPYNLTIHLILALITFLYLLWLVFSLDEKNNSADHPVANKGIKWILIIVLLQIIFGGFMAGTKAGLTYTTYPLMDGKFFPPNFFLFDSFLQNIFENTAAINFIHRTLAAVVVISIIIFLIQNIKYSSKIIRSGVMFLLLMIIVQFLLGVFTLLSGRNGEISIVTGVIHQFGAFIVAGICIYILYYSKRRIVLHIK
ncbi:MAG: COX15/CtaA family protein [Fimbriimonadaceae bacterium]|nr:COX15/CtaA family protein [Chitinophagales bacterium]